jgi:Trk K+ transport system NAD-binding subunit
LRWVPGPRLPSAGPSPRDHVLFLGCGTNTRKVLQRVMKESRPVIVVDDDPGVIQELQKQGVPAIRGDGADYELLEAAGAREAKVIVSTMRRRHDYERLLKHVSGQHVLVRVFDSQEGRRIEELGGTPVVESETAAVDFLARLGRT